MLEAGLLRRTRDREQLFDLTTDPMERCNLIQNPDYREVYADLSLRLDKWMQETNDPLIVHSHRVPRPEGAFVNRLQDLEPNLETSE